MKQREKEREKEGKKEGKKQRNNVLQTREQMKMKK